MGRYFALTLGMPASAQIKTKSKKIAPTIKINWGFWVLALIVVFGFTYVLQTNSSSTKGYEIKKLERSLTDLKEVNKRMELEVASLKSIQHLEQTIKTLNLLPTGQVQYVSENGYAYQLR